MIDVLAIRIDLSNSHFFKVTGPSNDECAISERVQQNLVSLVAETARPTDVFIQGGR